MGYKLAVIGATGSVGREILNILSERGFPADQVVALSSEKSEGVDLEFGDDELKARRLDGFDFEGVDIAFFAAGSEVSKVYVPKAAKAGAVVIDNSSLYRMDSEVPLVVPEVNADAVEGFRVKNIIANPNCSTAQLAVALKPLHHAVGIQRVVVATYQSVSGAGDKAMDELFHQTKSIYVSEVKPAKVFPRQIAFNIFPQVGDFDEAGNSVEENKMAAEIKKIMGDNIPLTATCVRVPVFIGHSEAVNVELKKPLTVDLAKDLLRQGAGVIVSDLEDKNAYTTPIDAVGDYATFVSRVRRDPTVENGLNFWVVSDNLRKGAALNAVQIAEILVNRFLK